MDRYAPPSALVEHCSLELLVLHLQRSAYRYHQHAIQDMPTGSAVVLRKHWLHSQSWSTGGYGQDGMCIILLACGTYRPCSQLQHYASRRHAKRGPLRHHNVRAL
ncbi:hypothetical protein M3J09_000609 [Ascochyta lentis]